ncbi:MAG TPA: biotin/lipoyl-containing protein [bacterium]|jgi:biotin carboxyl carrier protein|nr:biotin/lipoyl-containing protein [bacterium]
MRLTVLVILIVLAATPAIPAAPVARVTEVKATLTGEVMEQGLVRVGDSVRDGDPLVYVRTLVGRGVAARAPHDGIIAEVLVRAGDVIAKKGSVVVRLTPR